jgi:16S rRNA (adenine1518-N6/adenine1519-N6)-dimethyltransferase
MPSKPRRPGYKKKWGQHHLTHGALCRPLVEFLEPAGYRVVEIGPGGGVLTGELLAAGARVLACEVDPEWAFELRRRFEDPRLAIAVCDAMELPWHRLTPPALAAGNLPYNVATRIIEELVPHHRQVPRAAFLVQKEVADRLTARPGTKAYGALTLLVAAHARVRALGVVKPGSFHPPPKVAGAFVGLELVEAPFPAEHRDAFRALVHRAFGQRRKTLRNALSTAGRERAEAALAAAGLDPSRRAETLGLDEMLRLFDAWGVPE